MMDRWIQSRSLTVTSFFVALAFGLPWANATTKVTTPQERFGSKHR
jgi:hypothetical protein